MPTVNREIFINAPAGAVFDLISDVENFSRYSSRIKSIKRLPTGEYRWRIEMLGSVITWDAAVVDQTRPTRFAWRSTSGVYNEGSYELTSTGGGTIVRFRMEYSITGTGIEEILAPVLNRLMSSVSDELIERIKRKVER